MFDKLTYEGLSHLAIGRIAEYWTKLALTFYGLDVYTSEVDNIGIDFVVRSADGRHFDIQVKSIRLSTTSYIFIPKFNEWEESRLRDNLYLALVIIQKQKPPELYLIPSTTWLKESTFFKSRDYEGKKSKPEWGINISGKNLPLLDEFSLENQAPKMR